MRILASVLSIAFAAFCIWLAMRIFNRREPWAKRTAVGIAVTLALYVLGIRPACWTTSHLNWGAETVSVVYRPLVRNEVASKVLNPYSKVLAAPDWHWVFITPISGNTKPRWMAFSIHMPIDPKIMKIADEATDQ